MHDAASLPPGLAGVSRGRILCRLFWELFKISLFVLGGGFAIIATADDVFGRKLKWLKEGELLDHLPIFQTIPGLIAGNTAIYVGLKLCGIAGAAVGLVAIALPSYAIILAVACGFSWLPMDNVYVQGAFIGLRCAIAGLMLATLIKSWRRVMHGVYAAVSFAVAFPLLLWGKCNPAWILVGGMVAGILWTAVAVPLLKRGGRQ